jgi:cellulose synthase (UDP-forming)
MNNKRNELGIRIVALITMAYTIYYFIWRLTTFNPDAMWLSWLFWITELYGFFTFILFVLMTWRIIKPRIRKPKTNFSADIFVPTCGEPLDILHATMVGCNKVTYPHKTYILDDSGRKEVKE